MGIMETESALAAAQEQGLDLVEVAPLARPPVARIMDYGKFKFEQAKMARQAKKKQRVIELKEVKFRPGISDNDFDTKVRRARKFLDDGNKVKVTMMFRGRQIAHPELGRQVLRAQARIQTHDHDPGSEIDRMPKMKTHKGAKKRFSVTGTGKVRRLRAFKSHILTKKTSKRKRRLRQSTTVATSGEAKNLKRLLQA
jgi:translation initiation factor IF-3